MILSKNWDSPDDHRSDVIIISNAPPPPNVVTIFQKTLQQILPTPQERDHLSGIITFIRSIIESSKIPPEISIHFIEPEGSTGIKDTALHNAADIDLFIGLDPSVILNQNLSSKSARRTALRKLFKELSQQWLIPCLRKNGVSNPSLSYAEHPYVSAKYKDVELDIVLCFDISASALMESGPITAVDRSPHHSRFIRDILSETQKDDVRLLKYLFQCFQCYGDKSAIGRSGFIGYSCELLIAQYQTLWNFLQHYTDLESMIIVHPTKRAAIEAQYFHKSFENTRRRFFPNDFLLILDPTDLHRNVGASISPKAYYFMRDIIADFLVNPTLDVFSPHPIPLLEDLNLPLQTLDQYFFAEFHQVEPDHYTKFRDKLYKLFDQIQRMGIKEPTQEDRFRDIQGELIFDVHSMHYVFAFHTPTPKLEEKFLRCGPKVSDQHHAQQFRQKHPTAFEQDNYLQVWKQRTFTSFERYLRDMISQHPIKNLTLHKLGSGSTQDITKLAGQSMANLHLSILPYVSEIPTQFRYKK
ncbi:MAG: hypothetical protein ACTSWW_11125 [Promethearchaeota archaeon]